MPANPLFCTLVAAAAIMVGGLAPFPATAAESTDVAGTNDTSASPLVIAQASGPATATPRPVVPNDAFPAIERGVREAASQGNEALRRYLWRTRMIYNFYYPDFASGE